MADDKPETSAEPKAEDSAVTSADAESTEEEDKLQCLHQVEFYFADSNLPYDRFMWELHSKEGADHWVPLATVADFKRMRGFRDKYGLPWVADQLRNSIELLQVNDAGDSVRRKTEVKEPKGQWERTAYVKGFGPESEASQDKLERFFAQYAAVNAVRMRRKEDKEFKGSVFVEFANHADMEKFLALDPKPKWKDTELQCLSKEAYCLGKIKEKGLPDSAIESMRKSNMQARKGFNAFRDSKGREKKPAVAPKPEIYINFMGNTLRAWRLGEGAPKGSKYSQDSWEYVKKADVPHVKGTTLIFTGFGDNVVFTEVKNPLKELGYEQLPFIQYNRGDERAVLIFSAPVTDEKFEEIRNKISQLNGKTLEWTRADDEDEHDLQRMRANAAAQRALGNELRAEKSAGRGGRGGAGGRGGRGGAGGRGGGGGRGGRRGNFDRNAEKAAAKADGDDAAAATNGGGKRKRSEVEPDGGSTQGQRGQGVPTIGTAPKKAKTDDAKDGDAAMTAS
ncbi:hypothetical protein AURDEDRAFT_117059 [Auricularia subglabra TFB-10046 SS5]|nr:hypothetical protein AURDEDRAFT_117059 [Auricularia subglabra TFB-10046 SS5]